MSYWKRLLILLSILIVIGVGAWLLMPRDPDTGYNQEDIAWLEQTFNHKFFTEHQPEIHDKVKDDLGSLQSHQQTVMVNLKSASDFIIQNIDLSGYRFRKDAFADAIFNNLSNDDFVAVCNYIKNGLPQNPVNKWIAEYHPGQVAQYHDAIAYIWDHTCKRYGS